MNNSPHLARWPVITGLSIALLLTACADFASTVRKATYPQDFKYVTEAELKSNMQRLGFHLQRLDLALADPMLDDGDQQRRVISILRDMERIGTDLRADGGGASHPFMEDLMGDFAARIGEARIAASLTPPRYFLAGQVSGGCVNCHRVNR